MFNQKNEKRNNNNNEQSIHNKRYNLFIISIDDNKNALHAISLEST